ncbi:MAG: 16S rRNA (adenine(1518)-N(6)/adenine(1519)-N(6))-dimethyltransferase RsmA [Paludisphaera borealis]|uniref:16S rRNA (adenine(1518)-N(6)/adenine(1519)-N(6))- dimethyltransferase RsmA n=1 Tax=Paludisphaera borealis TaxID=1387353 RepID=UPI00284DF404|nr:16S rRNA (adenine(1518)-N(6)/adenine(1519)-N(6))-dimethyltransferase RsmA [Paludisphaera borealis]MDR3623432.1 16S rRNA (adenine(1518)-N(6)/adenine(1519)-N(6))-dimethyltransferase RsmA [Paludisphaera borealis]
MSTPPTRQTQSYLRGLFAQRGLSPRHRLGQNFLIDLNLHDVIAETAAVGPGDLVLEVGTGAGALTSLMAERGAEVLAVELDPGMFELAREATAGAKVRILNVDALAGKHAIEPQVLDALREARGAENRPYKLVANLPYNIATPLIMNLLVDDAIRPELMVVTIQKELAERMTAAAATSDHGALSVLIQALADVEIARILPPSVFWPRPKVESAVVSIRPVPERREAIGDLAWFHRIVREVFLYRRKNLRHVLSGVERDRWTKADVDVLLASLGLDGRLRAEALQVDEWITLTKALKAQWPDVAPPENEAATIE